MYKISKQPKKVSFEPYIGVIETEDNYFIIIELSNDLVDAKTRLTLKFKQEGKCGKIDIYKPKPKSLLKIFYLNDEQYEDCYQPVFEEMKGDVKKFLKKYCESVGVTFLAPFFPPPEGVITDKFIENIEFRRS